MEQSRLSRKQRNLDLDARFGRRLAAIRDAKGLSQIQVAQAMRFGRPLVSKIVHGQRALSAIEIPDYARALDIEPEELFVELKHVVYEYDSSFPAIDRDDGTPRTPSSPRSVESL